MRNYNKLTSMVARAVWTSLALLTAAELKAQSGAYFAAVTNLHPVLYFPLTETTLPPATKPAAANLGSLGSTDNGTYTDGAFPGVPGALKGDTDTAGLFSGATGVNPRVSTPYDTNYASVTNFTIEFWMNSPTNDPVEKCVLNCLDPGATRNGWLIYTDFGGTGAGNLNFRTYYGNGGTTAISSVIPVPGGHILANTWYHFVITYNGATATAQGYVNGQAAGAPATSTTSPTYTTSTAGPFCIGARSDSSFAFPGYLDEVAFYPTVLSAGDISNHYAAGTNTVAGAYQTLVTSDNPLLYFRFDEGAAPIATNYGSAGSLANGYYETGTTPGGQSGPNYPGLGGGSSLACQFAGGQSSDIGSSVPIVGAVGLPVGTTTNNPITVTAWIQDNSIPTFFTTVLGKGDQAYRFDINQGSGVPHWNVGNNTELVGGNNVADGNWHQWAGTWDGTNLVNLYIDGALVASATNNASVNGNLQPFLMGTAPDDTGRNFTGNMCQVAVFTNALSPNQVQQLFFAVGHAPIILTAPQNSVVIVGSNVSFSVSAVGVPALSYQWYSNSVAVAGATNTTFTVSSVTASANGASFYVTVTDPNSLQTTSPTVTLNVITNPLPGSYFSSLVGLNPLAYWPLNETNQPPAYDDYATNIGTLGAAGNAFYTGMPLSSYQQTAGLADTNTTANGGSDTNYSILVTGGQQVALPYSTAVSNEPPFTAEMWVSASAIVSTANEASPLSLVDANSPRSGWIVYMAATANGVWNFRTYNKNGTAVSDGSAGLSAATAVGAGEWHHLVCVVTTNVGGTFPNSSGVYPANSISVTMYLDGQETASTTNASYAMDDAGVFSIGERSDGGFAFGGSIEDVAYYTNALSATTISNHYANGTNTTPSIPYYQLLQQSSPMLFYQLNEAAPSYPPQSSDPVATNYGVNGSTDNGFYLPGSAPGAVAGPKVAGFPRGGGNTNAAVVFNHFFAGASPEASGYVDVPFESSLNIQGPITMAAWVKPVANDGRFQNYAGHSDSSYRMGVDQSMDVHFADANSAGDLVGSALNDGNWHFLVGTYDGANEYLYIDGILNASQPATGPATGSSDDFTIGVDPQYITSRMFDGAVSELALFDYALSGPQVLSLFYAADVAPIITQQPPATQTIGNGAVGTITAAAYGTPSLTYQWLKGGAPVSGAEFLGGNTTSLTITNTAPADAGSYSLVVSNSYGSVTSSVTVVTVSQVPVITPGLAATNRVLAGTPLILSVGEIGSSPFTNAWYFNGVLLTNGSNVSGATTTTLTISNASQANIGTYVFWTTNAFGSTNTSGYVFVDSGLTFDDNAAGWTLTDNNVSAHQGSVSNNVITLTDGKNSEITSFFYDTPMWIHAFKASFTYQDVGSTGGSNATADGISFCIQNSAAGAAAIETGGGGSGLGYYQLTNSVGLCAELYNSQNDDAPGIDLATNGQGSLGVLAGGFVYGSTAPVSLISGDPINFSIYYDGSNYDVTMTDATTAVTFNTNYGVGPIWSTNIVGSDTAYVGFTAATGGVNAVQTIANFFFTPIVSLSVSSSAGSVTLSWPAGAGGYSLQQSSSLNSTNWTTLAGPYNVVGSQYQYVVSPPTGTEFYRLVELP